MSISIQYLCTQIGQHLGSKERNFQTSKPGTKNIRQNVWTSKTSFWAGMTIIPTLSFNHSYAVMQHF